MCDGDGAGFHKRGQKGNAQNCKNITAKNPPKGLRSFPAFVSHDNSLNAKAARMAHRGAQHTHTQTKRALHISQKRESYPSSSFLLALVPALARNSKQQQQATANSSNKSVYRGKAAPRTSTKGKRRGKEKQEKEKRLAASERTEETDKSHAAQSTHSSRTHTHTPQQQQQELQRKSSAAKEEKNLKQEAKQGQQRQASKGAAPEDAHSSAKATPTRHNTKQQTHNTCNSNGMLGYVLCRVAWGQGRCFCSITASTPASHAGDPGSIPGRSSSGNMLFFFALHVAWLFSLCSTDMCCVLWFFWLRFSSASSLQKKHKKSTCIFLSSKANKMYRILFALLALLWCASAAPGKTCSSSEKGRGI